MCLRVNPYLGAIFDVGPQFIHVLIAHGHAAMCPVFTRQIIVHGLLWLALRQIARAMYHHITTGTDTACLSLGGVAGIGVGDVQRFVELAVGIAPVSGVAAFGRFAIAFGGFVADGSEAQAHGVSLDDGAFL